MPRPFVSRRYIDFSVTQSLRNMGGMIVHEVRRHGLKDNIKLDTDGIHEIEFIVQVFQLIHGGREPALQQHVPLPTLATIDELHLLPADGAALLHEAYLFLRRLENPLQSISDEQTQILPQGELNRVRLAWGMYTEGWETLSAQLTSRMANVWRVLNELIGDNEDQSPDEQLVEYWRKLQQDALEEDDASPALAHLSGIDRRSVLALIADFHRGLDRCTIDPCGRQVLDRSMPYLLSGTCSRTDAPLPPARITLLLTGIITRITYLELLSEFPDALEHLITPYMAPSVVAGQPVHHPLLLDELLDPSTLYQSAVADAYRDELRQYLLRVPEEDEEQQLEALRQFKQTQQLHITAADIADTLPMMKVSGHLTWLVEAILDMVVQQAWGQMTTRYGQPTHLYGRQGRGLAVVGYDRSDGWELGYSSDLDLVSLHDCLAEMMTDSEWGIDGRQFCLQLAQRTTHLFSTRISSGILYKMDVRLRPSGAAGMLVTTADALIDYQQDEAWTQEHQALVRTRVVYGDPVPQARFDTIRRDILTAPREKTTLQTEIREVHKKMRAYLGDKHPDRFDIKADAGRITNIEFTTQCLVLCYASDKPKLIRWSDSVYILELLARSDIMDEEKAHVLTRAYTTLCDTPHHLVLQGQPGHVAPEAFSQEREQVSTSWQKRLMA